VPTAFLIDGKGDIAHVLESWDSQDLNDFSRSIAARLRVPAQTIVTPRDNAVARKVG
jgi:hypothetical protein